MLRRGLSKAIVANVLLGLPIDIVNLDFGLGVGGARINMLLSIVDDVDVWALVDITDGRRPGPPEKSFNESAHDTLRADLRKFHQAEIIVVLIETNTCRHRCQDAE